MNLDFEECDIDNCCQFKTPKPLVFIVKISGYWRVYALDIDRYIDNKISVYFQINCFTYHEAKREFNRQLMYFEDYNVFTSWPCR